MIGQVVQVGGGVYVVSTEEGPREASLRGRIKQDDDDGDRVVIGDRVELRVADDAVTIESVLPRSTWLVRRTMGGRRRKIVAANLDRLLVLVSAKDPPPSLPVVDRMLVMGESGGLECLLVLTKVDLVSPTEAGALLADHAAVGYPVLMTSTVTGDGLDAVREVLSTGSSALVGPSGVGKSSLLNALDPGLQLQTQDVGRRSRSGRHTTVSARLVPLGPGGLVADTPGFSDVGLGDVEPDTLAACFPEFRSHLGSCRFRDCTHLHEPGCSVLEALVEGRIPTGRYDSYKAILDELATA
ncbi:MAG: ribosome small subunit-dependent GTPase A [Gemmatimonadetes bacterium]|nr:ribosome small subunit-dependent GTPase A [Gemmatimonadota bacterium]